MIVPWHRAGDIAMDAFLDAVAHRMVAQIDFKQCSHHQTVTVESLREEDLVVAARALATRVNGVTDPTLHAAAFAMAVRLGGSGFVGCARLPITSGPWRAREIFHYETGWSIRLRDEYTIVKGHQEILLEAGGVAHFPEGNTWTRIKK